ncbi:MAG: hypothetical protein ABIJ15_01030 [bacterium]
MLLIIVWCRARFVGTALPSKYAHEGASLRSPAGRKQRPSD